MKYFVTASRLCATAWRPFHASIDPERLLARPLTMKVIIAKESTPFAGQGRNSPRGRNAGSTLRLINAIYPNGGPESGQTIKGLK
jgi:hypothetical protein